MDKVSLIIPIYNEAEAIEEFLNSLEHFQNEHPWLEEIILIDDGSDDETPRLLHDQKRESWTLQTFSSNRGYGASLKTGIKQAEHDTVAIVDADTSYPIEQLEKLMESYSESDECRMVVGARTGTKNATPYLRRVPKFLLRSMANYLTDRNIPDLNSGFRVMHRPTVLQFFNLLPDGFSFTTTITLAFLSNNIPVRYVSINYYPRDGNSKINPLSDTINIFTLIVRMTLYFNPLKIYLPASFLLFLMAFSISGTSLYFTDKPRDVTFAVLFMTGVILLAIGMLADLIDKRVENNYQ